ncbi:hypothetical protein VNO77_22666 [Canavalia gladiata]|uniref:Uncharacterized protein n=1 Tax=Canavalia gladiata TaxID=3824 RepID=A0AAN9L305_CANGL
MWLSGRLATCAQIILAVSLGKKLNAALVNFKSHCLRYDRFLQGKKAKSVFRVIWHVASWVLWSQGQYLL